MLPVLPHLFSNSPLHLKGLSARGMTMSPLRNFSLGTREGNRGSRIQPQERVVTAQVHPGHPGPLGVGMLGRCHAPAC